MARTEPTYAGLDPPYAPGKALPELAQLLGEACSEGPPNHVHAAVRASLRGLGLDVEHYGSADWNPLGDLAPRGCRIVLKPNFIRHWNPSAADQPDAASIESVITHGAVVRAAADYAFLAAGAEGSVVIAEAPQHDCDFQQIRKLAGLDSLVRFYEDQLGRELEVIDLRREAVTYRDGVIVQRRELAGDPRGYRRIDLGQRSCFEGSGLNPERFRGADYDVRSTARHHMDGRNEYLLSETVLSADLVINLPKLKTHKKTGVTLALKNLVGINGDKNWLPHHCAGSASQGGDEYPGSSWVDGARSRIADAARSLLRTGGPTRTIRWARRMETAVRGEDFVRSGNWHGNRTTWRMCVDLNRCLYYCDAQGEHFDASAPVRPVLTVMDGVVAGDGNGPLCPHDVPLGAVIAATDPIAADLVALRLMGFDERNFPKVWEPMHDAALRITEVRDPDDVTVFETIIGSDDVRQRKLGDIARAREFAAHPGWVGHAERIRP
jgi:uncharacterized protein (DUF362 family)